MLRSWELGDLETQGPWAIASQAKQRCYEGLDGFHKLWRSHWLRLSYLVTNDELFFCELLNDSALKQYDIKCNNVPCRSHLMAPTMKTTPTNKLRPSVAVYTKQCTQIIYSSTRLLGLAPITGHLISKRSTTEFETPFFNSLSDQITSQVKDIT